MMTSQPLQSSPQNVSVPTWAALSFGLSVFMIAVGLIIWGAKVEARSTELHAVTEPLRRGDLVKIQTDVAWIRDRIEREERR